MPGLKLYVDFFSQPCRSVLALCQLKKINVETVQLRVNKKQHQTQHYKKVNPLQMVPSLQDKSNHINMGESHTIMRYLSRRYQKERPQLYPVWDLKRTTKIDQYLDYHHLGVRAKLFPYILNTVSTALRNEQNSGYNIELGKKQVEASLGKFNEVFLSQKYIVGEQISIADLSAYYEITFLSLINYKFSKWNRIDRWIKEMQQIPEVNNVNEVFLKMVENIKGRLGPEKVKLFQI